jgi:hypothetical protein
MDDATSPADGVHEICDAYARLQPAAATEFGISGHDDDLSDYSPDGHRARAELVRRALPRSPRRERSTRASAIAETVFAERIGRARMHDASCVVIDSLIVRSGKERTRE